MTPYQTGVDFELNRECAIQQTEALTVPKHSAELSPALRMAPNGLRSPDPPGYFVRPVGSCAADAAAL